MSLASILEYYAATQPDRTAVICGDERESYGSLAQKSRKFAAYLQSRGVVAGQTVAVLMPSNIDFIPCFFGVLAAGAVPVPLNPMFRAREIEQILADSRSAYMIYDSDLLEEGKGASESIAVTLVAARDLRDSAIAPLPQVVARHDDDVALVLYTSGSTGNAKGVMLTHRNLLSNIESTAVSPFAFHEDDVLMGCLPLSHTFGLICGMSVCFRTGARMILLPRFEPGEALRQMQKHACTVLMAVPTMLIALLENASLSSVGPTNLRRVYSGGSALPVEVLQDFERVFGCRIYEGYGLTEASPVIAYNQPGRETKNGTVGFPIPGVEVGISDPEFEHEIRLLPHGRIGEIVARGENIMLGYLDRPKETSRVLVDGWLRTGDLGVIDGEGYLSIVDRIKDMIIRGGYNVYPREIEMLLVTHPLVKQAAVVGIPDDRMGEEICAVLVPRVGETLDVEQVAEIDEWLRGRLARYKHPRSIEVVDRLPVGMTGKISKPALLETLAGRRKV